MNKRYHESPTGTSGEWRTPSYVFDAIGLTYGLDPCFPLSGVCYVPLERNAIVYTKLQNGLLQPWPRELLAFVNCPWVGRRSQVPWLQKFFRHGNGIAVCSALTSADWFHQLVWPNVQLALFTDGKVKFVDPTGRVGEEPGFGTALLAVGNVAVQALRRSGLGACVIPDRTARPSARSSIAPTLFEVGAAP